MFNKDKWNEIIEVLSANPMRTLITAFGVFWGIFILIILLSASRGLENALMNQLGGFSTNSMFLWTQNTSKPYKGHPQGRYYHFRNSDVEAIKQNIDGLLYVSPRNQLGSFGFSKNVERGTKTASYRIYGDYPEIIQQQPMDILQGRFINHGDIENNRKVVVIGEGVIKEMYDKDEDVLGTYLKVKGVNFMVVGVFKHKGNLGGNSEESKKELITPFTTFQRAFNYGDRVGWMSITAKNDLPITEVKEKIFRFLRERHAIDPTDQRAIGHFDIYKEFKKVNGLFAILKVISYVVGVFILGSGIIGITNIMLIIVKERTQEIGIRRALGATPWNIRTQILTESVVLSLIAGITGIVFSGVILWIVNLVLENVPDPENIPILNPSVNLFVVLIALLILTLAGLLAGFIPAQNAIKVKPIDALRTE